MSSGAAHARAIERSCAIVASAFSHGRCAGVRLMSGERRAFGTSPARRLVHVPYPALAPDWRLRTWTCGVALQCAPSKARIAPFTLAALTVRQATALSLVEGGVALGWVAARWPGLVRELRRALPGLEMRDPHLDGETILARALELADSAQVLQSHPLLG
jgi:hypothetical protein